MKNFLFLIGVILIVTSCHPKPTEHTRSKPIFITLNGLSLDTANEMINRFVENRGIYDSNTKTNIWFSKEYIDSLCSLLDKETKKKKPDGIRIYFAKDINGKYAFIIVSTRKIVTNHKDIVHQDYYTHKAAFLNSLMAKGELDYGSNAGAVLYNVNYPCDSNDHCDHHGDHYVPCSNARNWVNNYSKDTINTTSEWFDLKFLNNLREELDSKKDSIKSDGIRIYIAKRKGGGERHHFIVTTTKSVGKIHQDYFECSNKIIKSNDNGEQCLNNCNGTTWSDEVSN